MLGGKKEKELLAEVAALREENERQKQVLADAVKQKDEMTEHFTCLTASYASLEKTMEQMEEALSCVSELATESEKAAGEVHSTVMGVNNAVESFGASHTVFLGQLKKQNDSMAGFMEQQREIAPIVQTFHAANDELMECNTSVLNVTNEMREYAKTMGVLALNAAIEAGRLGESGMKFMGAAEEVRAYAEKYDASVNEISEQQQNAATQIENLKKQIEQLQSLVKEQTIATGKLYSNGMQTVAAYEGGQIDLRNNISFDTVGKADALQQAGNEFIRLQEEIKQQLAEVRKESREQQEYTNALENICKEAGQTIETELG